MSIFNKSPNLFEVTIEKLVHGGAGIARHQGKVIFVPFSVPGDHLVVREVEEKKDYLTAETVRILEPGSGRTAPICSHFEKCGGCQWQQLEYFQQVEAKRMILEESIHHRFSQTLTLPITMKECSQPLAYRSRARMQMRGSGAESSIGFFRPKSHRIENLSSCPLFRPLLNEALSSLRQFKLKIDTDAGLQHMDLACSEEEGSWIAARASARGGIIPDEHIAALPGDWGGTGGLLHRKINEFSYAVTASVFFQANDFIVPELAAVVRQFAKYAGSGIALDLFAGVGLFSLPLAGQYEKVVAVEQSPSASRLCSVNADAAGLRNIRTVCAEVSAWIKSEPASVPPELDLVLLDPPRTGATPRVMKHISRLAPKTIIYVSCDLQTLVRDLAAIAPQEYSIDSITGLDMFPQTYHFETIVRLVRK
jgi:23S rRNA (uracil1939-C5)-methyltransferase